MDSSKENQEAKSHTRTAKHNAQRREESREFDVTRSILSNRNVRISRPRGASRKTRVLKATNKELRKLEKIVRIVTEGSDGDIMLDRIAAVLRGETEDQDPEQDEEGDRDLEDESGEEDRERNE